MWRLLLQYDIFPYSSPFLTNLPSYIIWLIDYGIYKERCLFQDISPFACTLSSCESGLLLLLCFWVIFLVYVDWSTQDFVIFQRQRALILSPWISMVIVMEMELLFSAVTYYSTYVKNWVSHKKNLAIHVPFFIYLEWCAWK